MTTQDDGNQAESRHDLFVSLNANPEFVAGEFTDVILDLMRAVAADNDPAAAIRRASDKMHYLVEFMAQMKDGVDFHQIFTISVGLLRTQAEENSRRDEYLAATRSGLRYLTEISCFDNGARGRAATRLDKFIRRSADLGMVRSIIDTRKGK